MWKKAGKIRHCAGGELCGRKPGTPLCVKASVCKSFCVEKVLCVKACVCVNAFVCKSCGVSMLQCVKVTSRSGSRRRRRRRSGSGTRSN